MKIEKVTDEGFLNFAIFGVQKIQNMEGKKKFFFKFLFFSKNATFLSFVQEDLEKCHAMQYASIL